MLVREQDRLKKDDINLRFKVKRKRYAELVWETVDVKIDPNKREEMKLIVRKLKGHKTYKNEYYKMWK